MENGSEDPLATSNSRWMSAADRWGSLRHRIGRVRPTYCCDQSGVLKYFDSIEITLNLPKKRCTIVMLPSKSGSPNTSAV